LFCFDLPGFDLPGFDLPGFEHGSSDRNALNFVSALSQTSSAKDVGLNKGVPQT